MLEFVFRSSHEELPLRLSWVDSHWSADYRGKKCTPLLRLDSLPTHAAALVSSPAAATAAASARADAAAVASPVLHASPAAALASDAPALVGEGRTDPAASPHGPPRTASLRTSGRRRPVGPTPAVAVGAVAPVGSGAAAAPEGSSGVRPRRGGGRSGNATTGSTPAAAVVAAHGATVEAEPPAAALRSRGEPLAEPAGGAPHTAHVCATVSPQHALGCSSLAPVAALESAKASPAARGSTPRRGPMPDTEAAVLATPSRNTKRSLFGSIVPATDTAAAVPAAARAPSNDGAGPSARAEDGEACGDQGRAEGTQSGASDDAAGADRKRRRSGGGGSGELGMYTREEQALMAKVRGTIADPQCFLELEGAYDVHELVGDGTFSRVFKAFCRTTRQEVAVKRVYQTVHPDTILNEARYLQRLGGTCNVPKLLNVRYAYPASLASRVTSMRHAWHNRSARLGSHVASDAMGGDGRSGLFGPIYAMHDMTTHNIRHATWHAADNIGRVVSAQVLRGPVHVRPAVLRARPVQVVLHGAVRRGPA